MKIIWNTTEEEHKNTIVNLFKNAKAFECAVAFVKMSGFESIMDILEKRLKAGMTARFMVGLDFYLTDPEVLDALLRLSKKYSSLNAYVSNSAEQVCFHPKVYAFSYKDGKTKLLIGSANITAGGFGNNWECSLLCQQQDNTQMSELLDNMIENEELEKLSKEKIEKYREKHRAARVFRSINENQITRLTQGDMPPLEPLEAVVRKLKSWDPSPRGLQKLSEERAESTARARVLIDKIISENPGNEAMFKENIKKLRANFHASLLQIQIPSLVRQRVEFRELLRTAKTLKDANKLPEIAYKALMDKEVSGAGPNWTSEILHALNPAVYAVLNKNSVSGMALAQIKFPITPNKINISAKIYGDFCRSASDLTERLGLQNLSELDAVFNYAYFNYTEESDV